jgi:hypothetical protein
MGVRAMTALKQAEQAILNLDEQDALRVIHAASTIAAIPGLISSAARARAATRLREMMHAHPSKAEIFAAIVQHLESYP